MAWKVILAGAMFVLVAGGVAALAKRQSARFDDLPTAKAEFRTAGFYCVPDSVDERICTGFLLSREPISRESVAAMRKVGEMGSAWKGKVWVTLNPRYLRLESMPDDAATRTWGNIVAFGDPDLMSELDGILAQTVKLF